LNSKDSYSISELAREFGISTRTIRFYEEKGFIAPRREGQRRIYGAADRARIKLLLRGKRIGMTLAESMEIIEMYDPDRGDREQLETLILRVQQRRSALRQQLKDIENMLKSLDEVEALCRAARRGGGRARQKNSEFADLLTEQSL
jgi:DNA-binding transcriptional MerR regulator